MSMCEPLGRTRFKDVAKCNRVAQVFDTGNAVLPLGARWAAKQVDRARVRDEVLTFEAPGCSLAQPEGAGRKQRDADDVAEDRAVPVPAYSRARSIFRYKDLLEAAGRVSSKVFGAGAKPVRNSGISSLFVRPPPLKS